MTVAILLTVFAIGIQYAHLESSGQSAPDTPSTKVSEDEIGTAFYQQAIRLLPEIIEISSLESVQACLLFGYYALPVDASGLGFIYLNLTIRLGMQNGMHRKCEGGAFSPNMVETRNRLWWTAYVLERLVCLTGLTTELASEDVMPSTNPREEKYPSSTAGHARCFGGTLTRIYLRRNTVYHQTCAVVFLSCTSPSSCTTSSMTCFTKCECLASQVPKKE